MENQNNILQGSNAIHLQTTQNPQYFADSSKECQNSHYKNIVHLWEFLMELLADDGCTSLISWSRKEYGEFKLKDQEEVARRWGKLKKRPGMNYEKLSRALRYYYRQGIIKKVPGQKLVYKFDKLPYEYKPRIVDIRHAKQTQRQPCCSSNSSPQSSSSLSARRDSVPTRLSPSSTFPLFFQDSVQLPAVPFLVNSPYLSDYYQTGFLYNSRTPFQSWLEIAKAESSNDVTFPKSAPPSITTVKVPFSFFPAGNKHAPLSFSKLKLAKRRSIPVSVITKNTSQ